MKKAKIILVGNSDNIFEIFTIIPKLTDYVKYYITNDEEIDFFDCKSPSYLSNKECHNYEIIVDNIDGMYEKYRDELTKKYNISPNKIIQMKTWLANILETDDEVKLIPKRIRVDFCTTCQLNCRDCYMRKDNYGSVGNGYLRFENFKKLIDNNDFIKEIEMSNSGEVFLNPDIDKIITYAIEKNITLTLYNGTNFNNIKESTLELLVKAQVPSITFSIDGASNEIYQKYRVNGNLDNVIKNIKKLNEYKKKYDSDKPNLLWQFIVMKDNVGEILKAKKMAEELNMNIFYKREWSYSFIPENVNEVEKITGINYTSNNENLFYNSFCTDMIYSPQINWDVKLLGCCVVYRSDWNVNVFENGLIQALNSKKYRKGLITLLRCDNKGNHLDEPNPCIDCYTFTKNDVQFNI